MSNILRAVIMMKGTSVHANRRSDAFSLRVTAGAKRYMNYVVLIAPDGP